MEEGEEIRWNFTVPESGTLFSLQVDQGEIVLYASTKTTAPNEAFYQWKIVTSSSKSIFIKPRVHENGKKGLTGKQIGPAVNSMNVTAIPVFTTLLGLDERNTFTLTSGKLHFE